MNEKIPLFIDDVSKTVYYSNEPNDVSHLTGAFWIPYLSKYDWDGHIYVSGATGSGKSYLIKKIIQNDLKKRKVVLFTDLETKDQSLNGISYEKYNDRDEKKELIPPAESEWMKKRERNRILVFDDVQFNEGLIKYRDIMLEKGRHSHTIVICVNHKLRDNFATKRPLNESRYVVTFPCANKGSIFDYLYDEFRINRNKLEEILDLACKEGRHLIIHKHAPNIIATTETVIKL
jgi:GTPase SAR1 family protein